MTDDALTERNEGRIVVRNAVYLALAWPKILLALQTVLLWSSVTGIITLLTQVNQNAFFAIFFKILEGIWSFACLNAFAGGIGRMLALELQDENENSLSQARNFMRRYWVGLVFGSWAIGVATLAASVAVAGIIQTLTKIPFLGRFLGEIMIVPTFLLVLMAISLYFNTYMIPSIMGVDNCGALIAMKKLVKVSIKQPFQLAMGYAGAIGSALPIAVLSGIVTSLGLFASVLICRGENAWESLLTNWSYNTGFFERLSVSIVGFSWLAFVAVFLATSFSLLYYNASQPE